MSLTIHSPNSSRPYTEALFAILTTGYVVQIAPSPVDDNLAGDVVVLHHVGDGVVVTAWDDETEQGIGPSVLVRYEDISEITVY